MATWHNERFVDDFGQPMVRLTIAAPRQDPITIPLGDNYGYRRAEGAITLAAAVGVVLPFGIELDLNPDGGWTLRHVRPLSHGPSGYNSYLHFCGSVDVPPTDAQRRTLARWRYDRASRPYGATSGPGGPVQQWAFAGLETAAIEAVGNDGRPAYYAY